VDVEVADVGGVEGEVAAAMAGRREETNRDCKPKTFTVRMIFILMLVFC
jgi:hypothetical protein